MKKLKFMVLVVLCTCIIPFPVAAGDFDGSKPLLCAVVETYECGPGGDCQRGLAQSIEIPQFLKINFKEKKISGKTESGEMRNAKIRSIDRLDGRLILQGVQNGRGWSLVITEATGKMTMTASGDQVGFIVFGACTPQ